MVDADGQPADTIEQEECDELSRKYQIRDLDEGTCVDIREDEKKQDSP